MVLHFVAALRGSFPAEVLQSKILQCNALQFPKKIKRSNLTQKWCEYEVLGVLGDSGSPQHACVFSQREYLFPLGFVLVLGQFRPAAIAREPPVLLQYIQRHACPCAEWELELMGCGTKHYPSKFCPSKLCPSLTAHVCIDRSVGGSRYGKAPVISALVLEGGYERSHDFEVDPRTNK